ncbi:hypothetical protein PLESTB_000562500 [Pleodorina starrii]|uniref:Mce/MlaD domain-containing protein n=1 Tax=Pleodorina starrii TaxID=330485 RepID=A0A9W6F0P9_9CHLO|nr:hypothetical protein PLESTM_000287600 [Pleodorina starrii]GLC51914.1 hypothetical protein PLESTB_000562500 [Pleodorina starrii]GLC74597.1 hypothetical protein PLESTF_001531400 [Pleodorina starrii]
MSCAGARPLQKPGQCLAARKCQHSIPLQEPRTVPAWRLSLLRRAPPLRPASPVPAQPGGSSPGAGAASGPLGGSVGIAETNGAPSDAVFAASIAAESKAGGSSGASGNGGNSSVPVSHSARSSIRSVLKRAYLGEFLFVVVGSAICGALAYWTVGTPLRRFNPYTFSLWMPEATGVQLGTPLRMKGVAMGSVLSATPMMERVRVEVEVNEAKTIIPRNSRFELTQSGLIPAASIDITTPEGVSAELLAAAVAARGAASASAASGRAGGEAPAGAAVERADSAGRAVASLGSKRPASKVRLAGPKDVAACRLQGVLVCHGDELEGHVGGSMDELTAHMLKSLRQGEAEAAKAEGAAIVPGRGPMQG